MDIQLFIRLIPLIIELVKLAEKLIAGAKRGAEKKEFVKNGVKESISEDNYKVLEPAIDAQIDVTAFLSKESES